MQTLQWYCEIDWQRWLGIRPQLLSIKYPKDFVIKNERNHTGLKSIIDYSPKYVEC